MRGQIDLPYKIIVVFLLRNFVARERLWEKQNFAPENFKKHICLRLSAYM